MAEIAEIIQANERDRRTLKWLLEEVGEGHVLAALESVLVSGSRPYLSNVIKRGGWQVPPDVIDEPEVVEERKAKAAEAQAKLRQLVDAARRQGRL